MVRRSSKSARAAKRSQFAAINAAGVGLVFLILPSLLSNSPIAAALRPLSWLGWALLIGGGVAAWLLRPKAQPEDAVADAPAAAKAPRRPSSPMPPAHRVDPAMAGQSSPGAASPAAPPRPARWGPEVFAAIEWRRFEAVIEALFAQAGFVTRSQSHGADDGIDIWLSSKAQPDGAPVSVVQCKHWQSKPVGVDKVRELRGVMAAKGVARGQFATTGAYTPDALAFGAANGINLHDSGSLLALIAQRTPAQQQALLDVALEGDYWRPTCASCGVKMVERSGKDGGKTFWGCVNFPRCRTTLQKRAA